MLEKYIASLLVPYLSKYVENIDERQLSIDIWSGKATLNDLVLKKDVLNTLLSSELNAAADAAGSGAGGANASGMAGGSGGAAARKPLPVRVHRGVCKSVTLDIPLTSLRSRPVVLNIGEILITFVAPDMEGKDTDATVHHAENVTLSMNHKSLRWDRVAAQKARELEAFEEERRKQREDAAAAAATAAAAAAAEPSGNANEPKKGGFFSKLGEIVLNNIIVKAKAVHIRYEDVAHRVVLGAVLGGVQLLTIDDRTGEATFVDPASLRRMGKRLDLEDLQVYCDDPRHMAANEAMGRCWTSQAVEWQAWYHMMRQRARDGNVALSTVFGPITCSVDTRIVFKHVVREMLDTPYMTVTARLQHIIAHLTRAQYTTIVKSISRFTNWSEVAEVAARRPRVPVKGNAAVWWRFAIHTVMEVLREPREARLMKRISDICKLDYQVLYRDVVRKTEMSPEKKRSYRFITRFMTVEDMIAGRKHVYAQLANEIQLRRKDNEAKRAEAAAAVTAPGGQRLPLSEAAAAAAAASPSSPAALAAATQPPPLQKRGWFSWLRGGSAGAKAGDGGAEGSLSKEGQEEEAFFRALEKDYGITAAESDQDTGETARGSGAMTSTAQLPPNYTWLFLSLELPFMSYQIDMEDGESACLSFFQVYGQARSFNKVNSAEFHFSVQNLTLSNPAVDYDGGQMIPNLIEGVSVHRGVSPASSAPSSARSSRSKSVCVRSITDLDNGKMRPDRAPTLREMLGLVPGSTFNNSNSVYSQQSHHHARTGSSVSAGGGTASGQGAPDAALARSVSSTSSSAYATPLLSFSGALHPVEQPLADTKLDAAVCVKLLPLRVIADPGTIRRIAHFFRVPKGVDLSHFTQGATTAATAVGTAASQELRTAMASAKGLFLSIDASAPIFLLPKTLRATRKETTLAISLGRIRFQTQPLTESEKTRRLSSVKETEEMLYYSNRASFSKFFVELTTLEDALNKPETGMLLIPNVAVAADVLQRIDDRNESREKVIVRLKVPRLVVAISVHQAYLLTNMIDGWIRNWLTGAASSALEQTRRRGEGPSSGGDDSGAGGVGEGEETDYGDFPGAGRASLSESLIISQRTENTGSPAPPGTGSGTMGNARSGGMHRSLAAAGAAAPSASGVSGGGAAASATAAGRRSGTVGDTSGASVGVSTSSSPLAAPLVGRQEDLPVFRMELLVESLGLEVHEDDPTTLAPIFPARFSLSFQNAEFIMAVRTVQKKILLYFKEPCAIDLMDPTHPILTGTTALRVDVGLIPDAPVAVGVVIEPSLRARVGTPLIELTETVMDVVNLIMFCVDGAGEPSCETSPVSQRSHSAPPPLGGVGPSVSSSFQPPFRTLGGGGGTGVHVNNSLEDPFDIGEEDDLGAIEGIGKSSSGGLLSNEEANRQMQYLQDRKTVLSDLAYQLGLVRLQNAMPDTRSANISIHIDGTSTLELLNRKLGDTQDALFASASATDVSLFIKKNRVTMEITGKVAEARAQLADSHGLLAEASTILYRSAPSLVTPHHSRQASSFDASGTSPRPTGSPSTTEAAGTDGRAKKGGGKVAAGVGGTNPTAPTDLPNAKDEAQGSESLKEKQPHIAFTFRKSRPVMPIFTTQSEGKRVLANASELRYSSFIELELSGSTVTVDVHTVMLLKLYFTTGFFSRLSMLGDRPLYNGRTLPATREGPRLLMSVRVVARDITVVLPMDARRSLECFGATVGNVVVQSSLHAWEAQQTTSISLRELALLRMAPSQRRQTQPLPPLRTLLPSQAYIEVALRSPIDGESDEDTRLDVRSEDLTVDITREDLLDLCQLVRQNVSRADVDPSASVAVNPIKRVFVRPTHGQAPVLMTTSAGVTGSRSASAPNTFPVMPTSTIATVGASSGDNLVGADYSTTSAPTNAGAQSNDMIIGVRLGHAALRFSGAGASFELGVVGFGLLMDYPSYAISLNWKSLELFDTRGGTTSALIRCDEGEAHMADSLTTQAIVMADFGVRPSVSSTKGPEDASTVTADDDDANSRAEKQARGAGSLASSEATATPNQPLPQRYILTAAETGGVGSSSGTGGDLGRRARRRSLTGGGGSGKARASEVAAPGRELISMSVLSIAFTLRRFAVSDQWLSIYDYFCNEAVVAAWQSPQVALPDERPSGQLPSPGSSPPLAVTAAAAAPSGSGGGFRCVVTTPSVTVPFLTAARETLFEASLSSLLVDTVSFPDAGTQVAVKVQELEMVDGKSGERLMGRRRRGVSAVASAGGGPIANEGNDTDDDYYYSFEDEDETMSPLAAPQGLVAVPQLHHTQRSPHMLHQGTLEGATPQHPPPLSLAGVGVTGGMSSGSSPGTNVHGSTGANVSFHPPSGSPHGASGNNTLGGTHHNNNLSGRHMGTGDSKSAQKEPEALNFRFKADPAAHRNKISLSLGRLDVVCSMPLLYGMVDYFLSPTQPIARISSLGVMREQRERVARAAQEMTESNVMSVQVLWHQPRILLVGDGIDLKHRERRLEARLGTMRASVNLDKQKDSLSTSVRVKDFSIPTLLEKSALHVTYTAKSGVEEVQVTLDKVVGLFFPAEVEQLVYVVQGNLALPRETYYYGKFDTAEDIAQQAASPSALDTAADLAPMTGSFAGNSQSTVTKSPASTTLTIAPAVTKGAGETPKPKGTAGSEKVRTASKSAKGSVTPPKQKTPSPTPSLAHGTPKPPPSRTIAVLMNGLVVEMHDFVGINTHTFTLSSLSVEVNPVGDIHLVIPTISVVEHFTNCPILLSGETDAAGTRIGSTGKPPRRSGSTSAGTVSALRQPSRSPPPLPPPPSATTTGTVSNAPAAPTKPAITLTMTKANNATALTVSEVVFSLVPRGTGVLINTLLSVRIPEVTIGADAIAAAAAAPASAANSLADEEDALSGELSLGASHPIDAPIPASKLDPPSSSATGAAAKKGHKTRAASAALVQTFKASLDGCGLRFVQNETNVAFAKFASIAVAMEGYRDGSSLLYASVEDFTLMDSYSVNPTTRQIVARYVDDEVDLNATSKRVDAVHRKLLDFTLWTAPESDKLSRTVSISSLRRGENMYARRVRCEVANLSFTLVPEVVKALAGTVSEVAQHVSEANRGKAYDYVSDTATAAAGAVASKTAVDLTELEVVIHRPRFVVLHKADAESGVSLYPGRLTVRSELGLPEVPATSSPPQSPAKAQAPPSPMSDLYREIFRVRVERMGVKMLNDDAFKKDCQINIFYQSALPAPPSLEQLLANVRAEIMKEGFAMPLSPAAHPPSASSETPTPTNASAGSLGGGTVKPIAPAAPYREESELRVSIPNVSMNLSDTQASFLMDLIGAFMRTETVMKRKNARVSTPLLSSGASVASNTASSGLGGGGAGGGTISAFDLKRRAAAGAGGSPVMMGASSPLTSTYGQRSGQPQRAAGAAVAAGENRGNQQVVKRRKPAANPHAIFRTDVYIGRIEADLAELFRLHVEEAAFRAESAEATGAHSVVQVKSMVLQHVGAQVEVANATTGERHSTRVDDLVDLLTVKKLFIDTLSPPIVIDEAALSTSAESNVNIKAEAFRVAVSPTILFDTREMLYLPFCAKVLRQPIEPFPVLKLDNEMTRLTEDVVLDNMHVLLTCNRKRCCYHLDLNGNSIIFTGAPSGQIVLNEGCELTISNGSLVIPGLYSVGSYVSFGAATALFTTDTCSIEKQYQSISNIAFALHSDAMRSAANAALGALGDKGNRRTSTQQSHRPAGAGALPSPASYRDAAGGITIQQRNTRLVVDFACSQVVMQVLSEETPDLSTSICMEATVAFTQDSENDMPVRRNVSAQLLEVRSGENEQHTLLPTTVAANFSGVENVSVAIVFGPLALCARAVLLRSFVEIAKDFGAAFIEETTVKRFKPTIQLETTTGVPLVSVVNPGQCQNCGQHNAYLSESENTPGTLCYKCCTGRESMPATDFRVEFPLIDAVVLATSGDIGHLYVRNALLSLDPNMDVQLSLRGALHNFSNAAAVWEPFVEQFVCNATGSVYAHDYRIRIDRLDYVVSPLNIHVLSTLAADYASTTTLQKRMRKKFRRQTQQRSEMGYNTASMYVQEAPEEEDDRAAARAEELDDELTFGSTVRSNTGREGPLGSSFASGGVGGLSNMSIFDVLSSNRRESINNGIPTGYEDPLLALPSLGQKSSTAGAAGSGAQRKVYARVCVENWCNATLLIDGTPVNPRGGTLRVKAFTKEIHVAREQPYDATDTGYLLSLANPALYVQAKDFLMETRVTIKRDDKSRCLQRVVNIKVLPLHGSKTLICVENRLSYWLSPGGNIQDLAPGDRYYVRAVKDLSEPLVVKPTKMTSGLDYTPGVTPQGKVITMQEALTGVPVTLVSRPVRRSSSAGAAVGAGTNDDGALYARVVVRQDTMRGGVPTFIISIEPRYKLSNKLPYPVAVRVALDRTGDIVKGRARSTAILQKLEVDAMQKAEVGMGSQGIEGIAVTLEVHQAVMDRSASATKAVGSRSSAPLQPGGAGRGSATAAPSGAAAAFETFVSPPVAVKNGFVKLVSEKGRELAVRVIVSGGNILLTTPFALLNHTDFPLQLRESDKKGEIQRVNAERNYSTLAPKMNDSIAACPLDAGKEEFFVNVYSGNYSAKAIPLHVQQRGLILMEELLPPAQAAAAAAAAKERAKRNTKRTNLGSDVPDHAMLHLAYMSKVDASGAVLVTITPRWVVVNRSPKLPLYMAPTAQAGLSAVEAQAAATAQVTAETAESNSPAGTPTSRQSEVDAFKKALLNLSGATDARLTDLTYVLAVGPQTAEPLYKTPYCIPELGYHTHILQSAEAPLFGNPVQLETIHNEVIIAYRPRSGTDAEEMDDGNGGGNPLQPKAKLGRGQPLQRDRYLEVSLVAQDSYTYIVLEEPAVFPYLLLNRTRYDIELRDTAPKSQGRLMALAASGCGTELVLDTTVNTVACVRCADPDRNFPGLRSSGGPDDDVRFDLGRPMSASERATAKGGLVYRITYGEYGQTVVEICEAKPSDKRALSVRASPPTPINVLLNMALLTLSVVTPNRDILFAAVTDTRISWDRAQHKEEMQFSIRNFQVDNQTEISPRYESCILALRKGQESMAISGIFKRNIVAAKALLWFEEVRLDATPIALRVSDTLLVSLAQFARMLNEASDAPTSAKAMENSQVSLSLSTRGALALAALNKCPTKQQLFDDAPRQMDSMATRIVLDKLIVNPLLIRLWLTRDNDESDFFRDGLHTKEASLLSMMIPSCEDVNISAPGLVAIKRSSRLGVLMQWIAKSYTEGLFAQLQGVLLQYAASLPLIGAPVKLFSGIGSGAVRLFKDPIEGLSTSPKAFALGLASGSGGFAAGFAGGGLGAFANLTNAGSRLLSMGGGVSEKERRKQNTWTGLTSGIAGIVQRPMEGAAESGASGFAKGAAHGLVGVLANPLSGLLSDVSRATGTMAKLVTDTYIPETKRLRPIRPFHANGGVAPWRSVITVYQYEREKRGTGTWSSSALLSSVDGPEWYPCRREAATFGTSQTPVPPDLWALDRYNTSFEGWTYSSKYYGYYTGTLSPDVHVRRKRWTALVRPLPYSPTAFYLGISPGMARAPRLRGGGTAALPRTGSGDLGSGAEDAAGDLNRQTTSTNLDYAPPGTLNATTVEEAKARRNPFHRLRQRSRSRSHSRDRTDANREGAVTAAGVVASGGSGRPAPQHTRTSSGFFDDEEYAEKPKTTHQRMQGWTAAGRNVGVKTSALRTMSADLDDDESHEAMSRAATAATVEGYTHSRVPSSGALGADDFVRPSAPQRGSAREARAEAKAERRAKKEAASSGDERGPDSARGGTVAATTAGGADRRPLPVMTSLPSAPAVPRLTSSEEAAPATTATVDIYEYQRKATLFGWGTRGLPATCPAWQDVHGNAVPSTDKLSLPPGWQWADAWRTVGGSGGDGWEVLAEEGGTLRRRLWRRTRVKADSTGKK